MENNEEVFFKPAKTVHIPTKDLLSWIFDEPKYSQDEPVSRPLHEYIGSHDV